MVASVTRPARLFALATALTLIPTTSASAAVPNACRRTSPRGITVLMDRVKSHRAILGASRGGRLRLVMPSGVDSCRGTVEEIRRILVQGRRHDDIFSLKGSRALERGRFFFFISLSRGHNVVRFIGTGRADRITTASYDTSSFVERFVWRRVGWGGLNRIDRLRMLGRRGRDVLTGRPLAHSVAGIPNPSRRRLKLVGGAGPDQLTGGRKNDRLLGSPANDHLLGGKGDDVLRGGSGADLCRGGPGIDQVSGC